MSRSPGPSVQISARISQSIRGRPPTRRDFQRGGTPHMEWLQLIEETRAFKIV